MQAHLRQIAESYSRANFGPVNRTTARDLLAAAKLTTPEATPSDVATFMASKFRDKRPYPYENGLRTFGGMIVTVHEDFQAWVRSQPPKKLQTETTSVVSEAESACADSTQACGSSSAIVQAPPINWVLPENCSAPGQPWIPPHFPEYARQRPASSGPCTKCSGRGYQLDDSGTEQVDGEELKTIAALPCDCSNGRKIAYGRLAAVELTVAERSGAGWISAHRPFTASQSSEVQAKDFQRELATFSHCVSDIHNHVRECTFSLVICRPESNSDLASGIAGAKFAEENGDRRAVVNPIPSCRTNCEGKSRFLDRSVVLHCARVIPFQNIGQGSASPRKRTRFKEERV